ncbi:MAG: BatA domain-containing protein [Lentisphaeraceae bacterium]|nr:BatA domain-containing protein [Lentisphaeraceae bacterium]
MTFIEPLLFWILVPFVALPVLIHLINRMRYTPMKWAAMDFLFRAKRSSTKFAKLREILILTCRCLALLFLAMALARPLSGGWLGSAFSGDSETVIILLDRSSSMSSLDDSGQVNKVQKSVALIQETAAKMPSGTSFVVIDSSTLKPIFLKDTKSLSDPVLFGVTDAGASMKDMVSSAYDYILSANPGNCELWLTTDLQMNSWQPESQDWATLNADFKNLKSNVAFRVLALSNQPSKNKSISIKSTRRVKLEKREILEVTLQVARNYTGPETIQLAVNLNGAETVKQISMTQDSLLLTHQFELASGDDGGFGSFSLPDDKQPGDNFGYFAYGKHVELNTAIVSQEKHSRLLALAAAPPRGGFSNSEVLDSNVLLTKSINDYSLIIWDKPEIEEQLELQLIRYVKNGGQLLVFAQHVKDSKLFSQLEFGAIENAEEYKIGDWNEAIGPLADSLQGESLPVSKLKVTTRQLIKSPGQVLASYEDGQAFLSRIGLGRGTIYYCSTNLSKKWSDLYKGAVLLPMLSRLVSEGSKKFSSVYFESSRYDQQLANLEVLLGDKDSAVKSLHAGVYQKENDVYVLNRPAYEDGEALVDEESLEQIFDGHEFSMFNNSSSAEEDDTQSEMFSLFALLILIFLAVEGFLTLQRPLVKEVTA